MYTDDTVLLASSKIDIEGQEAIFAEVCESKYLIKVHVGKSIVTMLEWEDELGCYVWLDGLYCKVSEEYKLLGEMLDKGGKQSNPINKISYWVKEPVGTKEFIKYSDNENIE